MSVKKLRRAASVSRLGEGTTDHELPFQRSISVTSRSLELPVLVVE
jgi:hypothetical protein